MKKRGKVTISFEALGRALWLRDDVEIIGVRVDQRYETLELILSGEDLPPIPSRSEAQNFPLSEMQAREFR